MAQSFDFGEIISLLNHSKNIAIDSRPVAEEAGRWSLHMGRYTVHTSSTEFEVLYLGSSATRADVDQAERYYRAGSTQVVYANSLDRHATKYHHQRLGSSPGRFWSTRDYLKSFIRDELDVYLTQLKKLQPRFYTEPQVETPLGVTGRRPNRLLSFLTSPRFEAETAEGLTVLLGEPGQGKTYMSQHLVSALAMSSDLVPIYINSSQWQSMSRDDLGSLQKTIAHSFRYFEAPIAWLEGQEERFLRATLKADLFRVVFDGFDEYILRNEGRLSVTEALEELTELVRLTGARVVVTSRTSFWDSNVDEKALPPETRNKIYKICPFEVNEARRYFGDRFGRDGGQMQCERAVSVYIPLSKRDPGFVGRGFVLKLIGDLVEGTAAVAEPRHSATTMDWLVQAFCDREAIRQGLPLSGTQQLGVFEVFASEVAKGCTPDSEALELCVCEVAPDLTEEDRVDCLKRMEPHPLLEKATGEDRWGWSEEQVGNVFLARWLCRLAGDGDREASGLRSFLEKQSLTAGQMNDLASMVVNVAPTYGDGSRPIRAVLAGILRAARGTDDVGGARDGRTLAAVVALRSVDQVYAVGSERKVRGKHLVEVLGGSPVRGIAFTGTVAAMDLRGIAFTDCRFDKVVWANVELDERTTFDRCHFVGGIPERSSGLGRCQFGNCTWDAEARRMIMSARAMEGKRRYSREDLRADVSAVVSKFVNRSGFLRTVEVRNLNRGTIRNSKYGKNIVDAVKAGLLERHHISGVKEGGMNVRSDCAESVLFFVNNGVMTGRVRDVVEGIAAELNLGEA